MTEKEIKEDKMNTRLPKKYYPRITPQMLVHLNDINIGDWDRLSEDGQSSFKKLWKLIEEEFHKQKVEVTYKFKKENPRRT